MDTDDLDLGVDDTRITASGPAYPWRTILEKPMNERIKELLSQAGDHYVILPKGTVYEKFAELIVEECGEIAYKAYWDNPVTVRGIHIKEKIKKHFGVK